MNCITRMFRTVSNSKNIPISHICRVKQFSTSHMTRISSSQIKQNSAVDNTIPTVDKTIPVVNNRYQGFLRTCILDWSGTTADKYVIAPAIVFYNVFKKHGVPISMEEARLPMGLRKDLHIEQILEIPDVKERWTRIKGHEPTSSDVDTLFEDFLPMQLECLPQYSGLLDETLQVVDKLRTDYGLSLGLTTGFTRAMVDVLLEQTKRQGLTLDVTVAGDEVTNGARPKPFMVYRNLDLLNAWPIQSVVKVDDTVGGVGEGLNAGCWSVGIARYSNYMNINTYEEEEELGGEEVYRRLQHSRHTLCKAGPHYVIDTLEQLPAVIKSINFRLANGLQPGDNYNVVTFYGNEFKDYKYMDH